MARISVSAGGAVGVFAWRRALFFFRSIFRRAFLSWRVVGGTVANPVLGFCPYLPLSRTVAFADWEIGPLKDFDARWSDRAFESRAKAFIAKFVDGSGRRLTNPAIICRRGQPLNGTAPTLQEVEALEIALGFAFLDENVRRTAATENRTWSLVTSDNAEPFFWPIDVASGHVAVRTGRMITTLAGGYTVNDAELIIRPPLDLHMPMGADLSDRDCVEAVYSVALQSLQAPRQNVDADKMVTSIRWFIKAWRNTASVDFNDRVVMLKTAFETITGSSTSHVSASRLRALFETLSAIASPTDADRLVWSPAEFPRHTRTWTDQRGTHTAQITDIENWFMAFAALRNEIIHEGASPSLTHRGTSPRYDGPVVFTAEYLFRAAIKVQLHGMGRPNLWRSSTWRVINAAYHAVVRAPGP